MKAPKITPYLVFDGTCRQAMAFYKECLGGELMIQPVAGTPAAEHVPAGEAQQGVLHSSLTNGDFELFASDAGGHPVTQGDSVSVSLNFDNAEDIASCFGKMAAGGTITMPLADAFWGATFGMLTDKFGINWLFNYDKTPAH